MGNKDFITDTLKMWVDALGELVDLDVSKDTDISEEEKEEAAREPASEEIACDGVLSLAFDEKGNVMDLMYNKDSDPWAMAAALCDALACVWPGDSPKDDEMVFELFRLGMALRTYVAEHH